MSASLVLSWASTRNTLNAWRSIDASELGRFEKMRDSTDEAWSGKARSGKARYGKLWFGKSWWGKAVMALRVVVPQGPARQLCRG
jgi:hypothetical protein